MNWRKVVLISASILVVLIALLWYLGITDEPVTVIAASLLTLLGYVLSREDPTNRQDKRNQTQSNIHQNHKGKGDNVINKNIYK